MNVNKNAVIVGASVASAAAGAVAGYFFAKRQLEEFANKRLEEEIEGVKQSYRRRFKEGEYATPESAQLHIFKEAAVELGYVEESKPVVPPIVTDDYDAATAVIRSLRELPVVPGIHPAIPVQYNKIAPKSNALDRFEQEQANTRNIFQEQEAAAQAAALAEPPSDRDWTWDKELDWRNQLAQQGRPYVISDHEFFSNEPENDQTQLTFYRGDNALINNDGEHIPNIHDTINQDNLARFGAWSNNPTLVYVRNMMTHMDYEIEYSELNYAVDILNLAPSPTRARFNQ